MGLTSRLLEAVSLGTVAAPPTPALASQFTPSYPAQRQRSYSDTRGCPAILCLTREDPLSTNQFACEQGQVSKGDFCSSLSLFLASPFPSYVAGLAQLPLLLYCSIAVSSLVWLSLVSFLGAGAGAVSAPVTLVSPAVSPVLDTELVPHAEVLLGSLCPIAIVLLKQTPDHTLKLFPCLSLWVCPFSAPLSLYDSAVLNLFLSSLRTPKTNPVYMQRALCEQMYFDKSSQNATEKRNGEITPNSPSYSRITYGDRWVSGHTSMCAVLGLTCTLLYLKRCANLATVISYKPLLS